QAVWSNPTEGLLKPNKEQIVHQESTQEKTNKEKTTASPVDASGKARSARLPRSDTASPFSSSVVQTATTTVEAEAEFKDPQETANREHRIKTIKNDFIKLHREFYQKEQHISDVQADYIYDII